MASSSNPVDRFRKILECSICLEVYEAPKTLKCAHEFCQYCLEDIQVFHDDGSVTITCPLRCEEKTQLSKDQTIDNLGTPYTIKSMLDTLQEDMADTNAYGKPLCKVLKNCKNCASLYCCGIMCKTCFNDHIEKNRCDEEKLNLTYSMRENKLRVVCDRHLTRCTHICNKDEQFLCVYCVHRDGEHKDHQVETVEEAAHFIRTALRKELQRSQRTEESLLVTVVSVDNAKSSLKEVLEQRMSVMPKKSLLKQEVKRLTELFDKIADAHIKDCEKDIATISYCEELLEKHDIELVRQKKNILDATMTLSSRLFKGLNVSLTDGSRDSVTPLGNIHATVVDANSSQSSLNCNWCHPGYNKTSASLPGVSTKSDAVCEASSDDGQGLCKSITLLQGSLEDHGVTQPIFADPVATSNTDNTPPSGYQDAATALSIDADSSCNNSSESVKDVVAYDINSAKSDHVRPSKTGSATCKSDIPNGSQKKFADDIKLKGNEYFKQKQYVEAIECYSQALSVRSVDDSSKRVYYQNRAAAHEQLKNWFAVVDDCSCALELDPLFVKALNRRSRAYEKLGQKREAYEDILFVSMIERNDGVEQAETIESLRRTLHTLTYALAEQQQQRKLPPMLPAQHILRKVLQTFNYDPFTIPLTTQDCDSNYSEILRNLRRGKYGNVMKFCDKEVESRGLHRDRALLLRGFIKYCMGDDTTVFDFYGVLDHPQNEANALLQLTARLMIANRQLFVEDDIPGGMFFLESALSMGIEKATVYSQEGTIHKHAKRIVEAKRCFSAAIALDKEYFEPRLQLACIVMEGALENPSLSKRAEKVMMDFVRDFPDTHMSWLLYGNFLAAVKRYDEAMEKFDKAILLGPTDPEALSCKARCLSNHYDKKDEAEKFWLKAIKIDKRNGTAFLELGHMEFKRVNWDAAWKYLQRAVDILADDISKTSACYNWMEFISATTKYYEVMESYRSSKEGCSKDLKEKAAHS